MRRLDAGFRSRQAKAHGQVWAAIFKDQKWLNMATKDFGVRPVLLGKDLNRRYYGHGRRGSEYLVLVAEDKTGDLRGREKEFFASLHEHTRESGSNEIYFQAGYR
jgi:hypothetical protein